MICKISSQRSANFYSAMYAVIHIFSSFNQILGSRINNLGEVGGALFCGGSYSAPEGGSALEIRFFFDEGLWEFDQSNDHEASYHTHSWNCITAKIQPLSKESTANTLPRRKSTVIRRLPAACLCHSTFSDRKLKFGQPLAASYATPQLWSGLHPPTLSVPRRWPSSYTL